MNATDWQSVMARIVAKVEVADDGCIEHLGPGRIAA
jgi:hypothetical protein